MFNFGINTGLRVSDIVLLKISDIRGKSYLTMNEQKTGESKHFAFRRPWTRREEYKLGMNEGEYVSASRKGNGLYIDYTALQSTKKGC